MKIERGEFMGYVLLIMALGVSSFICLIYRVSAKALIMYMKDKNYTPPTGEELRACMKKAWYDTLHIK